jgi:hypothetical protein
MQHLLNHIRPIIQQMQKLMIIQAKVLRARFEEIPKQRSKGIDKIDYLKDDLFAIVPHTGAIEDIKHLNEYLATIETEATEYYA